MICDSCGEIAYQWTLTKWGVLQILACEDCPLSADAPTPAEALIGAVLLDDGSARAWERAKDTLLALTTRPLERAIVAWCNHVAELGAAPSIVAVMKAMGPARCVAPMPWLMRWLLTQACEADDIEETCVEFVRDANAARKAG